MQTAILSIVTVVALGGGSFAIYKSFRHTTESVCRAAGTKTTYTITADQAENATTITAVGKRMGLPDHAVTVALAAALQESKLHNVAHGDRDSLGLFQQRPSQGWGTAAQVLNPTYAAEAFFSHLAHVSGWESLPIATAAQEVQHSAAPDAYQQWEPEARALAIATTGESPAAFTCRTPAAKAQSVDHSLSTTMTAELGSADLAAAVVPAHGWVVASWLVAHAHRFGISSVAFAGRRWTPSSGKWADQSPVLAHVQIERIAGV